MSSAKSLHDSNDPTKTVVSGTPAENDPTKTVVSPAPMTGRHLELEAEILDELRRMNRLLYGITYGPRRYTLSFLSGVTRGLGAVLGATLVFGLFVGALSYLDTTPLIGNYVRQILFIVQAQPHGNGSREMASPTPAIATPTAPPAQPEVTAPGPSP